MNIHEEQTPMFTELPIDNPIKLEENSNCMNENLAKAMTRRGIEAADIKKNTNIPWGTLMGWIYGDVKAQHTDDNLLDLITYLECTCDWLCFGIGTDTEVLVKFKDHDKNKLELVV